MQTTQNLGEQKNKLLSFSERSGNLPELQAIEYLISDILNNTSDYSYGIVVSLDESVRTVIGPYFNIDEVPTAESKTKYSKAFVAFTNLTGAINTLGIEAPKETMDLVMETICELAPFYDTTEGELRAIRNSDHN
jgi:hypothetical protein